MTEPRDERGRWTSGSDGATTAQALREGVATALSGVGLAAHDRLDLIVSRFEQNFRGDVGGALAAGKADGAGVLADVLNQLLLRTQTAMGHAPTGKVAELRGIAIGLQPGQSEGVRLAAVEQLREMLRQRDSVEQLGLTLEEVERVKLANISELARVLENEAGSDKDQPVMEAVGHTVLDRMLRNKTNHVVEVSGQYTRGRKLALPTARNLAIKLLNGVLTDITHGATHFYQPYAMTPLKAVPDNESKTPTTAKAPEGYEYVPGVVLKNSAGVNIPAFSRLPSGWNGLRQIILKYIPDSLGRFYIMEGNDRVR